MNAKDKAELRVALSECERYSSPVIQASVALSIQRLLLGQLASLAWLAERNPEHYLKLRAALLMRINHFNRKAYRLLREVTA